MGAGNSARQRTRTGPVRARVPFIVKAAFVAGMGALSAGCGPTPQCHVYFAGDTQAECDNLLAEYKEAKTRHNKLMWRLSFARDSMQRKIKVLNGENPEGLDIYNEVLAGAAAVEAVLNEEGKVVRQIKRGEVGKKRGVETTEVWRSGEAVSGVLARLGELEKKLEGI